MTLVEVIIALVVGLIVGYIVGRILKYSEVRSHRKDAIDRSRFVVRGQVSEKIAPLLPNFPYEASDMTFIGKWCDYIVFRWIDNGSVDEIVFLEIKSGQSRQNEREKLIENAVKNKRVRYEILRLGEDTDRRHKWNY